MPRKIVTPPSIKVQEPPLNPEWPEVTKYLRLRENYPERLRVLAVGDSWFDFPLPLSARLTRCDITLYLEAKCKIALLRLAEHGDCIAESPVTEMRKTQKNESWMTAKWKKTFAEIYRPSTPRSGYGSFDALLLSGGGNDFVGDKAEISFFMQPAGETGYAKMKAIMEACATASPDKEATFIKDAAELALHKNFHLSTAAIIKAYGEIIDQFLKQPRADRPQYKTPAVLINGYDFPFASNKGAGLKNWAGGPWLYPGLKKQGWARSVGDPVANFVVKVLLSTFFVSLESMCAGYRSGGSHVVLVQTQRTLSKLAEWHDEMHPYPSGFEKIAAKFQAELLHHFPDMKLSAVKKVGAVKRKTPAVRVR